MCFIQNIADTCSREKVVPALEKKWLINETTVEVCCLLEQLRSAKEHIQIGIDAEDYCRIKDSQKESR